MRAQTTTNFVEWPELLESSPYRGNFSLVVQRHMA